MSYPLPARVADRIFDILVKHAGASERDRDQFIYHQSHGEGCNEFRFCGHLCFGGKFWNTNGRWYVSCYKEDSTPERETIIKETNERLTTLHEEYIIHPHELPGLQSQ